MESTRATLVERLRDPDDSAAWNDFYKLYSGLIYRYARAWGINDTDAMDVVGDCLESLSRRMREFNYDPDKCKFRSYLRVIVNNKVISLSRRERECQMDTADWIELQAPDAEPGELWEKQWAVSRLLYCWAQIEKDVSPLYASAFRLCVIQGTPAKQVAETLGVIDPPAKPYCPGVVSSDLSGVAFSEAGSTINSPLSAPNA